MSGRWRIAIAVAAVAAVAIPAGVVLAHGLAGSERPGQAPLRGVPNAPLHPVGTAASPAVGDAKSRGGKGVALSYLQTKKLTVPPGRSSQKVGPTPKKCRAINGYYFIPHSRRTKISSEGDSLAGFRHWLFYRNNKTGTPVKKVVYGVVCLRGAKLIG